VENVNDLLQYYKMPQDGKRLKEKELLMKLLWNEGLAGNPARLRRDEEKAIAHN
jgi:hypothetical protein